MEKNFFARAFELAPGCNTIDQLRNALSREGYVNVDEHLRGPSIRSQLNKMLHGHRPPRDERG